MEVNCESELREIEGEKDVYLKEDIRITTEFETIPSFSGTLYGQGNKIIGLDTYFIENIEEKSCIQNIKFKNADLTTQKGIFKKNNGKLKNISIIKLTYTGESSFGSIVFENHGLIEDCSVLESSIHSNNNVIGGLCAKSKNESAIINCTIMNTDIFGKNDVGGIVGKLDSGEIDKCKLSGVDITGIEFISSLAANSTSSLIKNCTCTELKIKGQTRASGFVSAGHDNIIKKCKIKDSDYIGSIGTVLSVGREKNAESKLISCSVQNCFITVTSQASQIYLFTMEEELGEVKDCYVTDTVIKGEDLQLFTKPLDITHSYADIKLLTDEATIESYDSPSFYADITKEKLREESKVTVTSEADLLNINEKDTVVLDSDITVSDTFDYTIDRFTGTFDGNGYTIQNLSNSLFNYFGGELRDLKIENSVVDYMRKGFIAEKIENAVISNITILSDSTIYKYDTEFTAVGGVINYSEIDSCDISIKTKNCNCYGLCKELKATEVKNCSISLDVEQARECAGIAKTSRPSFIYRDKTISKCSISGSVSGENCSSLFLRSGSKIVNSVSDVDFILTKFPSDASESEMQGINIRICSGGLLQVNDKGTLENCVFKGSITVEGDTRDYIGGIVGINKANLIKKCINNGKIRIKSKNNTSVGGLVGLNSSKIKKCVNDGIVIGGKNTGGIAGINKRYGEIVESLNINEVKSYTENTGGLVGFLKGGSILKVYNDTVIRSDSKYKLFGEVIVEDSNIEKAYLIPSNNEQKTKHGESLNIDIEEVKAIMVI